MACQRLSPRVGAPPGEDVAAPSVRDGWPTSNKAARDYEGRSVLRWAGDEAARVFRHGAQADGQHRLPAHPVALDEILCPLWPYGVHTLPGLSGRPDQEVLRRIPGVAVERFPDQRERSTGPVVRGGHCELDDHVRR